MTDLKTEFHRLENEIAENWKYCPDIIKDTLHSVKVMTITITEDNIKLVYDNIRWIRCRMLAERYSNNCKNRVLALTHIELLKIYAAELKKGISIYRMPRLINIFDYPL